MERDRVIETYSELTGRSTQRVEEDLQTIAFLKENFYNFLHFFRKGSGWFFRESSIPHFIREICSFLKEKGNKKAIILPRGFAKTTTFAKIYPIYLTLFYPDVYPYIVIFSLTEDNTRGIRSAHKKIFYNDVLFNDLHYYFPYFFLDKSPVVRDNEKELVLSNGSRIEYLSIQAEARGLSSEGRPKLIIMDDIVPTKVVNSEAIRNMIEDIYFSMIEPMGEKDEQGNQTDILVLGTIIHNQDFVARISRGEIPGFSVYIRSAYDEQTGEVLWEEKLSLEEIKRKKEEFARAGHLADFYREYMNKIISEETHPFSDYFPETYDATLRKCRGRDFLPDNLYRVLWIDHASGIGGDDFVIVEIGMDSDGNILVLDTLMENKISVEQRIKEVYRFFKRRRPHVFGIEWTSESITFIQALEKHFREQDVLPYLVKVKPSEYGSKNDRILTALHPVIADKKLLFPSNSKYLQKITSQFQSFNTQRKDNKDDFLDALSYAVLHSKRPSMADEGYVPPKGSFMYGIWKSMHKKQSVDPARWPSW